MLLKIGQRNGLTSLAKDRWTGLSPFILCVLPQCSRTLGCWAHFWNINTYFSVLAGLKRHKILGNVYVFQECAVCVFLFWPYILYTLMFCCHSLPKYYRLSGTIVFARQDINTEETSRRKPAHGWHSFYTQQRYSWKIANDLFKESICIGYCISCQLWQVYQFPIIIWHRTCT